MSRFLSPATWAALAAAILASCAPLQSSPPEAEWGFADGGTATGLNVDPAANASYPQLASFDGAIHITWFEDAAGVSRIHAARGPEPGTTGGWRLIDAGGLNRDPDQAARWSRLVVFEDRLYCYWYETLPDETTTVRVAVYNGDAPSPSWSYLDGDPAVGLRRHPATGFADYASLEPMDGKLYAAWRETDGVTPYQIRVAVWNGDDAAPVWSLVDGAGATGINVDPGREAYYPKLTAFQGKLYAMWYELNGSWRTVRAAVYNGEDDAPAWTIVGGAQPEGLNFDSTKEAHGPQLLVASDTLYATWYERGGDLISHPRFVRYNVDDAQPAWTFVDGGGPGGLARDPTEDAWWPRAAALGPYVAVAWTEREDGVYRVRASLYDTVWDRWTPVEPPLGLNYDPLQSAEYAHAAVVDGRLYVAWSERRDGALQVRVAMGSFR